jgi:Txe/YoeB family toxin of Txe-Axe toxin-antitoxin module
MEIKSRIFFAEEKVKISFEELKNGKIEEQELYKRIKQALENLKSNAFSGIQIPKKLIPPIYISKYSIDNLWKYDLPKGWRLLYSVGKNGIEILSIVLEWMDHKEYERKFHY